MLKKTEVIMNYSRNYGMIINEQKSRFMAISGIFDTRELDRQNMDCR